jgi:hypothetical protein
MSGIIRLAGTGVLLAAAFASNSCKTRSPASSGQAGIKMAGSGPSEADLALAEFEVVDCTPQLCDGGQAGVALANPAPRAMDLASARIGAPSERNPYGSFQFGSGDDPNTAYALTGAGGGFDSDGSLDSTITGWTAFGAAGAGVDRSPVVAAAVETVIAGVLGPEVARSPEKLEPVKLVDSIQQLDQLFRRAEAKEISEAELVAAIDQLLKRGLGHPQFEEAARRAVQGGEGLNLAGPPGGGASEPSGSTRPSFLGTFRFAELAAINRYYMDHFIAQSPAAKTSLLTRLKGLLPRVKQIQTTLERHQITEEARVLLMETARSIAGQDGYINRGDLPRILPVIPELVGQVADQKISEGLADGIAKLRRERPTVYRRWVRAPNGLIGRAVNREVNGQLAQANAQKWAAINKASSDLQGIFNGAMARIGASRYFLGSDSPKNYYDPANPLELEQINRLVFALTGKSVQQVAGEAVGNAAFLPAVVGELQAPVNAIFDEVELPDGIFIEEAISILKQKIANPSAFVLPPGIRFILDARGKIKIAAVRDACTCEFTPKFNQCVFFFKPQSGPEKSRDVLYYQPLGAPSAGNLCDDNAHCANNFARRDFQFYLPHACGHIFRTKPGDTLFTM